MLCLGIVGVELKDEHLLLASQTSGKRSLFIWLNDSDNGRRYLQHFLAQILEASTTSEYLPNPQSYNPLAAKTHCFSIARW